MERSSKAIQGSAIGTTDRNRARPTRSVQLMTDVKCGGGKGNAAKGWNCARARGTERKERTATSASMTHKMRMRCIGNNGMTSADWTGVAGATGAGRGRPRNDARRFSNVRVFLRSSRSASALPTAFTRHESLLFVMRVNGSMVDHQWSWCWRGSCIPTIPRLFRVLRFVQAEDPCFFDRTRPLAPDPGMVHFA